MTRHARVIHEKSIYHGLEGEVLGVDDIEGWQVVDLRLTSEGADKELIERFLEDELEYLDQGPNWPLMVFLLASWAFCGVLLF